MADEHKPHIICLNETIYISEAEIAEENNGTTSFGEKGLFICRHIYLGKKLLSQINSCCQEVTQNNEMTFPWFINCWMLVASRKKKITRWPCWLWILSPKTMSNMFVYGWTTTFRINGQALRDVTSFFCILQSMSAVDQCRGLSREIAKLIVCSTRGFECVLAK